jgi:hypothetical protein
MAISSSRNTNSTSRLFATEVEGIALTDSYGSLYFEEIPSPAGLRGRGRAQVGIHTHNNQQVGLCQYHQLLILGISYLIRPAASRASWQLPDRTAVKLLKP